MFRPLLCLGLLLIGATSAAAGDGPKLTVSGTTFQVATASGKVLSGADLAGANLIIAMDGERIPVRIKSVTRDTKNPNVLLNEFVYADAQGREQHFCKPSVDGVMAGFPVTGRMNDDGSISAGNDGHFEITCTSGAQGKCIRFGYEPDKSTPDGKSTLRDYFNACIHLVRGDYGGSGAATTRDGTMINIYDRIGIQKDESTDSVGDFEAGFSAAGAVCVARPRIRDNVSLDQLVADYPRLAGHVGRGACDEEIAAKLGALVFVKSNPDL